MCVKYYSSVQRRLTVSAIRVLKCSYSIPVLYGIYWSSINDSWLVYHIDDYESNWPIAMELDCCCYCPKQRLFNDIVHCQGHPSFNTTPYTIIITQHESTKDEPQVILWFSFSCVTHQKPRIIYIHWFLEYFVELKCRSFDRLLLGFTLCLLIYVLTAE